MPEYSNITCTFYAKMLLVIEVFLLRDAAKGRIA